MYDAIIIGGGTAGYACAIRIAQLGGKPLLIEKDKLGGCCANKGCIPTKALLRSARLFYEVKEADRFGIKIDHAQADFEGIFKRIEKIVSYTRKGIEYLLNSYNIEIVYGEAKITARNRVAVNGKEFEAKNIAIATGSIPRALPGIAFNDFILNSDTFFDLNQFPKKAVIIGGGAVGVEFANILSFFDAEVNLVEMAGHIVPGEDAEISIELEKIFKRYGINIYTKSKADIRGNRVEIISGEDKLTIEPEKVIVAIGRRPLINEDNLRRIGIQFTSNGINVNNHLKTNIDNIYAIGDVTGKYLLAHVASRQAIVAGQNIMGLSSTIDYRAIPNCIYTRPEIGSIGLRSQDDKSLQAGKFPFVSSGKARTDDNKDGFIKALVKDDKVVGLHIIGGAATELIGEAGVLINSGISLDEAINSIHPHPTFSEGIVQALEDINDQAMDMPKKRS